MTKNENKAKIMAKKLNKSYAIRLTPELSDGLRYISDKTKKTQIGILQEILLPIIQQAVSYERFSYQVVPDRNTVQIIFYGSHGVRLVSGSNNSEIRNDSDLFEFMVKKSMEKDTNVTKEKEVA
jgi:hypothetical protein